MKYNYNSVEFTSMVENFNVLATGDYKTARDMEKRVLSYCNRLNTKSKTTALEAINLYANLSNVFDVKLPEYEKIEAKLIKKNNVYKIETESKNVEVLAIDAYKTLVENTGYSPVNWSHVGYSLLSLINVEFDQNDIINFKPCTIGQIKDLLSYFGNCSSKMVRTMCELVRPSMKKKGTIVLVKVSDEEVIKAYIKAKSMNLMTKQYGKNKEA